MTGGEYLSKLEHGNINERAVLFALRYGQIDGVRRKQWVIDQLIKRLAGNGYPDAIQAIEDETGQKWDTGTAP